jgi:hypothetical protein
MRAMAGWRASNSLLATFSSSSVSIALPYWCARVAHSGRDKQPARGTPASPQQASMYVCQLRAQGGAFSSPERSPTGRSNA